MSQETTNAITEYSATAAGLSALQEKLKGATYDITTTDGMTLAKVDRRECVKLRGDLETMRKKIKDPALAQCRLIDSEAKRIELEIRTLENPIDKQIKDQEKIKDDARIAREEEKRKKSMAIMEQIEKIKAIPEKVAHKPAINQTESITWLSDLEFDEEAFGTFYGSAVEAKSAALESMTATRDAKSVSEAEEAMSEAHRLALIDNAKIDHDKEEKRLEGIREEQRVERERLDKIDADRVAEETRINGINEKIDNMKKFWPVPNQTAIVLKENIATLTGISVTDVFFMEFTDKAATQRSEVLTALESTLTLREEKEKFDEDQRIENKAADERRIEKDQKDLKERMDAEKERKRLARATKLAEAKCKDSKLAFKAITVLLNGELSETEKLAEIAIIAEANS